MKNARTVVTALAATALLAAGSGLLACKKKEPETIKIGVILPLTGNGAELGKEAKNGIETAVRNAKETGLVSEGQFEFLFEDSKGEPTTGVSAFRKLTEEQKVKIIIGDLFSAPTLAIAPLAEEKKILLFPQALPIQNLPMLAITSSEITRRIISKAN